MRRFAMGMAGLAGVLILALAAGFTAFVAAVDAAPGPVPPADGIVALTGGAERVETALRLLDAGKAKMLLVSGVAHGAGLGDLARRADLNPALLASRVTLGRTAATTFGNAEEAAEWTHDHGFRSLIVVTAAYHMPRAMLEMRRAMPEVTIHALPVHPPGITGMRKMRLLLTEYAKLLAAWIGLSTIAGHQLAIVHRHAVDNSVSG